MSTHNLCFELKYKKYQNFLSEIFPFLVVKFSIYLNRCVFVMNLKIFLQVLPLICSYGYLISYFFSNLDCCYVFFMFAEKSTDGDLYHGDW